MPRLAIAERHHLDQVYRESHAVWGIGLSRRDYVALWTDLSRTPWAREHARFYVWLNDEGEVLSSLKLYRPLIRIGGSTSRASLLGAIFTPRVRRRRGHAAALIRAVLERGRERGDAAAMLFSDIGTRYYASLGFHPLPAEEQWGTLPRRVRNLPENWTLRPLLEGDLPALRQAHLDTGSARALAVVRDETHWEFLLTRSRVYFERLGDRTIRQRWVVALREGRFAGFVVAVEGHGEWSVREVAALGGDPRDMASIVRVAGAAARREGLHRFYGWLPPEVVEHLADWKPRHRSRRRAVPMLSPLGGSVDLTTLDSPSASYVSYLDQF